MGKLKGEVEVRVSSGKKIIVPKSEQIALPNGQKVWISKIVPGDYLAKSVLYDPIQFPSEEERKRASVKGRLFRSKLALADSYEEALPVTAEHHRCVFCQSPKCSRIVTSSGVEFTSEICPPGLFLYASKCTRHGLEFVNARYVRIEEKDRKQPPEMCWICKAPKQKLEKITPESDFDDYQKSRAESLDFWNFLTAVADEILYKCLNCGFVLDTELNIISLEDDMRRGVD